MSGTFVASGSAGNSSPGTTLGVSFSCSAGERIFVQPTCGSSGGVTMDSVSDGTNTYYAAGLGVYESAGPTGSRAFVCDNASAVVGGTLTITYSGSVGGRGIVYSRYTGTDTNAAQANNRQTQAAPGTGANAVSSLTATPSAQPNMFWGICLTGGSPSSVTAGTSPLAYTDDGVATTRDAVFGYRSRIEHCSTAATTARAATFTEVGTGDLSIAHVVVVGEPGGAATIYHRLPLLGVG